MANKKATSAPKRPATQRFLDIAEIRDDMVILKDGTVRAVLLVSSINFALKSRDEQEAITQAYMTFLNSIDFPIQIVIQSRKMNIDGYIDALKKQQRMIDNDLLRSQIASYRQFVEELVQLGEIMQKRFYVVVPYDPLKNKQKGFFQRFSEVLSPSAAAKLNAKQLSDRIEQLSRRVDLVAGQLGSMSLQVARLDTQSLIELYYTAYNPDTFDKQPLAPIDSVEHESSPQSTL